MRRFLSITVLLCAISQYSTAQTSPSCCQASSIQAFTDLANDMAFVIAHEEPLPFTLENPKGENISFPVKGEDAGKTDRSVAYNWPGHCGIWNREFRNAEECRRVTDTFIYLPGHLSGGKVWIWIVPESAEA